MYDGSEKKTRTIFVQKCEALHVYNLPLNGCELILPPALSGLRLINYELFPNKKINARLGDNIVKKIQGVPKILTKASSRNSYQDLKKQFNNLERYTQ